MDEPTIRVTLSLIAPGILLVFAVAFIGAWAFEKRHEYLLLLAGACALFAAGATVQVLYIPSDTGLNALISGALYTAAVIGASDALLRRAGRRLGWRAATATLVCILGLLWYFFYIDRNLVARIYVQNFGYGAILLITAVKLRRLAGGRLVDRILFWTLLAFAVQFFPRTVLTVEFGSRIAPAIFAASAFWQTLQLSLAVMGAALAMAVLAVAVHDIVDSLRQERDLDQLTGLLNRRGFDQAAARLFDAAGGRCAAILVDIDHFKSVNDTFGHATGDAVLEAVGGVLKESRSNGRAIGRIGGEEFAIIMAEASAQQAVDLASSLREQIGRLSVQAMQGLGVTASFGVECAYGSESLSALIRRADRSLYAAKADGRNTVSTADTVQQIN